MCEKERLIAALRFANAGKQKVIDDLITENVQKDRKICKFQRLLSGVINYHLEKDLIKQKVSKLV